MEAECQSERERERKRERERDGFDISARAHARTGCLNQLEATWHRRRRVGSGELRPVAGQDSREGRYHAVVVVG